jgi:hypothetical protein
MGVTHRVYFVFNFAGNSLFLQDTATSLAMKYNFLLLIAALMTVSVSIFAQERKDKAAVTYEELYDEPYSVNKLFVQFQPLYGELFATNVNAGFGLEASYYYQDKADFRASFRKTYSRHFFDYARDISLNTSDVDNRSRVYNYIEFGGTYHIKDFEESSKTTMYLYKSSYKGNKWASRVPLHAEVPCKVRKIYGARLGGIMWASTTNISKALEGQGKTNADLKSNGESLPTTFQVMNTQKFQQLDAFSNIAAQGLYVGGSMSWIHNVAVNFDKFEEGIDDLMLTAYLDVMYSPSIKIDDVVYTNRKGTESPSDDDAPKTYSVSSLKTRSLGFRAGVEGKFNRTFSWAYGGEIGYRPGIQGKGFFALVKVSFPVFGTNLDYKVEAFGK